MLFNQTEYFCLAFCCQWFKSQFSSPSLCYFALDQSHNVYFLNKAETYLNKARWFYIELGVSFSVSLPLGFLPHSLATGTPLPVCLARNVAKFLLAF